MTWGEWLIDRQKGREFNPHGPFILMSMLQGQQSQSGLRKINPAKAAIDTNSIPLQVCSHLAL